MCVVGELLVDQLHNYEKAELTSRESEVAENHHHSLYLEAYNTQNIQTYISV